MHMVSKRDLNYAELETMTANGEVQTREEATVYVKEMNSFVTVMLLQEAPTVFHLENCAKIMGCTYHWTSGLKPHLTKSSKKIDCKKTNYVPFVVPGLSTSSSTSSSPVSSTSSSQDTVISAENPATERSEIMSEESRGNPRVYQQSELLQDVLELFQDFKDNLVDKNVQPHQYSPSSCHEHQWSRKQKWYQARGSMVFFLTSRKTEIVTSA